MINMRKALLQVIILQVLVGVITSCQNTAPENTVKPLEQKKVDRAYDGESGNLNDILADFNAMKNTTVATDTLLMIDKDTFSVALKHMPIEGSGVVVPKKYVGVYKLDSFSMPAFKTSVIIRKGDAIILKREILKEDFQEFLDPSLKSYAILLSPYIVTKQDHIELHHSISVPLTDVGIGVTTEIDKEGHVEFKRN